MPYLGKLINKLTKTRGTYFWKLEKIKRIMVLGDGQAETESHGVDR